MILAKPRTPLQYRKWIFLSYLPRMAGSLFFSKRPKFDIYGEKPDSKLRTLIGSVNLLRPTPLCCTMTWHGSDKGRKWHNYTAVYSQLFGHYHGRLRIFELGLGTNNPTLVSSMGATGRPGASLRGWRDTFPEAAIFGADIDRDILFTDDRIRTFYCDQLDQTAI